MKFVEIVKQYWNEGLTVVPFNSNKKCLVSWKKYQTERPTLAETINMFSSPDVAYIALICKDGIEAIDIDSKNEVAGQKLAEGYGKHLQFFKGGANLLQNLVIEKTKNNGLHFIYRTDSPDKNTKLAYNPDGEVIIETRGEGGLLFIAPSEGYELRRNNFLTIPTITNDEKQLLFNVARSFNVRGLKQSETVEEVKIKSKISTNSDIQWSWDDYNSKDDVLQLLKNEGWVELSISNSTWTYFNRPGAKTKTNVDASWHNKEKYFYIWTASDVNFESEKGYNATQVFAAYKTNGDLSQAAKELFKKGYGTHEIEKTKEKEEVKETKKEIKHKSKILDFVKSTKFDVNAPIIEEPACLFVEQGGRKYKTGGFGMLGAIVGKQKSGKSTATGAIIASAFCEGAKKLNFSLNLEGKKIQYYDTEQSGFHYQKSQSLIYKMAGKTQNIPFYSAYHLRRLSKKDRLNAIKHFIYEEENLGVVIIDGIVDIVEDFNDLKESQKVVDLMLKWADEKNVMILTILHLNKDGIGIRGHLGTALQNKADFIIEVKNNKESADFKISSRESRFAPFPSYSFTRNGHDGMAIIEGETVQQVEKPKIKPVEPVVESIQKMPKGNINEILF